MSLSGDPADPTGADQGRRTGLMHRLRNYLLTGLVIAAPLFLTLYITWTFVKWVDGLVEPLIPSLYRLDRLLPIPIPGFGLIVALIFLTLLGFLTANFVGSRLLAFGESLLDRMPLVRNLYRGLKQIFETVVARRASAFQKVALIEYPRKGLWSIVFVASETRGEVDRHLSEPGDEAVGVFLPTTPNPTSGFLLFVKRRDLIVLDMSVEDAAKMVISAGLVTPEIMDQAQKDKAASRGPRPRPVRRINPPSAA
jgi:uncharacterized membrane protein